MTEKANFCRKSNKAWLKRLNLMKTRIKDRKVIHFMVKNTEVLGQSEPGEKMASISAL